MAPSDISGTAVISQRAAARLHDGHVWVYRSDLERIQAQPGELVRILDTRERLLGTALYSSTSKIALRLISRTEIRSREAFLDLFRERLSSAIEYRRRYVQESEAYRIVFGEADGLPGVVVDRYAGITVVQFLAQATDQPDVREAVISRLREELSPAALVERCDTRIRDLEQLEHAADRLLDGEIRSSVFQMNGLRFVFDAELSQKTGAFLDQRQNYRAAAQYGRGQALDVCTYHGGFALHLNQVCSQVTGVDSSRAALERAEANERLNSDLFAGREIEWIEGNAFDLMRDYSDAGRRYDTIVLDPPAFTKAKRNTAAALGGYKELNLRALKMLRPGGVLVTCSCSHHVSRQDFLEMLGSAAVDADREVQVLEERGQSIDHPVLLNVPETSYLKCIIATAK